ncbi:MAG: type II toxin-antitoxin system HicA family toxin [Spirochaetaceae bacterium]|nr:type II toxin-antitoxin system HicA family toxin [Spirochaetaceae bacterium]
MNGYEKLVKAILLKNGCYFVRSSKGSHETWHSPITHKNFTVPHTIKPRHTANKIMKDAGINHKF